MVKPVKVGKNERMSFSKINEAIGLPNLIEIQKDSYQWFLDVGLMEVLRDVSPSPTTQAISLLSLSATHLMQSPNTP